MSTEKAERVGASCQAYEILAHVPLSTCGQEL